MKMKNGDVSKHFSLSDFVECGDTYQTENVDNLPRETQSIDAIKALATHILDPLVEEFVVVVLTYGLATKNLVRKIPRRIAPKIDQHAAHELTKKGNRICSRDGFAVDILVPGISSTRVAKYVVQHLPFDRLYYYGVKRPLHVSYGPDHNQKVCLMNYDSVGDRWLPRNVSCRDFLSFDHEC
jgi:hypothetical protein